MKQILSGLVPLLFVCSSSVFADFSVEGSCSKGQAIQIKTVLPAGVNLNALHMTSPDGKQFWYNFPLEDGHATWKYSTEANCKKFGVVVLVSPPAAGQATWGYATIDPTKVGSGTVTLKLNQCKDSATYYVSDASSSSIGAGFKVISGESKCPS